jgi:hypothetical protein
MTSILSHVTIVVALIALTSCRAVYYSAMEKVGFEKRDLLVRAVKNAKAKQKEVASIAMPCSSFRLSMAAVAAILRRRMTSSTWSTLRATVRPKS